MKITIGLAVVAAVILLFVFASKVFLPALLIAKIEKQVHENCARCSLKISELQIELLHPGWVDLSAVNFSVGNPASLRMESQIETIRIGVDLWDLLKHRIHITGVEMDKPDVTLQNHDSSSKSKSGGEPEPPSFVVESVEIHHGHFKYTRATKGTSATLQIQQIEASVTAFGTDQPATKFSSKMQVEQSGEVHMNVEMPVFTRPLTIDVQIGVVGQNLADLNAFLNANSGVKLNGRLLNAQGSASVRGNKLEASVEATYDRFALHTEKFQDRSELAAFFTDLGASIMMNEKNTDHARAQRRRKIETQRQEHEPLVAFILRGFKEAAIKVSETDAKEKP